MWISIVNFINYLLSCFFKQVTWIENVEVDDQVVQNIYKPLVNSGLAFGAKRWVATLHRQSDRLVFKTATNVPREHHGI